MIREFLGFLGGRGAISFGESSYMCAPPNFLSVSSSDNFDNMNFTDIDWKNVQGDTSEIFDFQSDTMTRGISSARFISSDEIIFVAVDTVGFNKPPLLMVYNISLQEARKISTLDKIVYPLPLEKDTALLVPVGTGPSTSKEELEFKFVKVNILNGERIDIPTKLKFSGGYAISPHNPINDIAILTFNNREIQTKKIIALNVKTGDYKIISEKFSVSFVGVIKK